MKIILYGVGAEFSILNKQIKAYPGIYNDEIVAVVDRDSVKQGRMVLGVPIQSPEIIKKICADAIVITPVRFYEEIKNELERCCLNIPIFALGQYRHKKTIDFQYFRNLKENENSDNYINKVESSTDSIVVYTAIIGDYDDLKEPKFVEPNIKYICFTDRDDLSSDIWEIRKVESDGSDHRIKCREYKIRPHLYFPEFETSIWVDGCQQIRGPLTELIRRYRRGAHILVFPHMSEICIYDVAMGERLRDSKERLLNQIFEYYKDGYPIDNGFLWGGVLIRDHNDVDVIKAMDMWFNEVINYSKRDQISLPYVLWKCNVHYDLVRENLYDNEFFEYKLHKSLDSIDMSVLQYVRWR